MVLCGPKSLLCAGFHLCGSLVFSFLFFLFISCKAETAAPVGRLFGFVLGIVLYNLLLLATDLAVLSPVFVNDFCLC